MYLGVQRLRPIVTRMSAKRELIEPTGHATMAVADEISVPLAYHLRKHSLIACVAIAHNILYLHA